MTKNKFLLTQIDQFSKLKSKEEKAAFWADFSNYFDNLSEKEQTNVQQEWKTNVNQINNRLNEISKQLNEQKTIEIFPKNKEETLLIEKLLLKMNVSYNLK